MPPMPSSSPARPNVIASYRVAVREITGTAPMELVERLVGRLPARLYAEDVILAVGCDRRSAERKLRRLGLPSPGRFARLLTLLSLRHLAATMDNPPAAPLALALGFTDEFALYRYVKRAAGMPYTRFLHSDVRLTLLRSSNDRPVCGLASRNSRPCSV